MVDGDASLSELPCVASIVMGLGFLVLFATTEILWHYGCSSFLAWHMDSLFIMAHGNPHRIMDLGVALPITTTTALEYTMT